MNPFLTEEDKKNQKAIDAKAIPEFLFKNKKGEWIDISVNNSPFTKKVKIPPDFNDNEYFYKMLILKYYTPDVKVVIPPDFAILEIEPNIRLNQDQIAKIFSEINDLTFEGVLNLSKVKFEKRRAELNNLYIKTLKNQTKFIAKEARHLIIVEKCDSESLLYYFDQIKLTDEFPSASVSDYLKIYKGIKPLPEWITQDQNYILLIYHGKNIFIFIDDNYLKVVYIHHENIDSKILQILQFKGNDLTIEHHTEIVRGSYLIKNAQVRPNIFAFLAKNDKLFRKYIQINEFSRASFNDDRLTISYFDDQIQSRQIKKYCDTALGNFKTGFGKLTIRLNNVGSDLQVIITRSPNKDGINLFIDKFQYLFQYYLNQVSSIRKLYKDKYNIILEKRIKKTSTGKKQLKDLLPTIFGIGYSTNCVPKQRPKCIANEDVAAYRQEYEQELAKISHKPTTEEKLKLLKILKFPANDEDMQLMTEGNFPTMSNELKKVHAEAIKAGVDPKDLKDLPSWFVCDQPNFTKQRHIPANNGFKWPRLGKNNSKPETASHALFPKIPCCLKTFKLKKEKKSEQTAEITGNKKLAKGKIGLLPSKDLISLFYYLDPSHIYHRLGINDNILTALNKIFKKKINKKKIKKDNLACCMQENWNITIEKLHEKWQTYIDPFKFLRILEQLYDCQIFIFTRSKVVIRRDKIIEIPRLAIPPHNPNSNYYRFKNSNKIILLYQHFGTQEDNTTPYYELIFSTNRNNENTKYTFNFSDTISININKLFNFLNYSFSLNYHLQPITYPFKDLPVTSQFIDAYGKCRGIVCSNDIIATFDPMAPLNVPLLREIALPTKKQVDVFLKQYPIFQVIKESNCYIKTTYKNITMRFPIKPRIESQLAQFQKNIKIAKYLTQYLFYLFSKFLKKKQRKNNLKQFAKRLKIDPNVEYEDNTSIFFKDMMSTKYVQKIKKKKCLMIQSEALKKRMLYLLSNQNIEFLRNYHRRKIMINYYTSLLDFTIYPRQLLLKGPQIMDYFNQFNYTFQNDVNISILQQPYFVRHNGLFQLYQNSYNKASQSHILNTWDSGKGYNDFSVVKLQETFIEEGIKDTSVEDKFYHIKKDQIFTSKLGF